MKTTSFGPQENFNMIKCKKHGLQIGVGNYDECPVCLFEAKNEQMKLQDDLNCECDLHQSGEY
jgi:hypothetical protein